MTPIPWYRSNVFMLALLGFFAEVGSILAQAPDAVLLAAVRGDKAAIGQLLTLAAVGLVALFRARSSVQPLSLGDTSGRKIELPVMAAIASAGLFFCLLPGCTTTQSPLLLKVELQQATYRAIDAGDDAAVRDKRAVKIAQIAALVQERIADSNVLLADLERLLGEQITRLQLAVPDELLARDVAALLIRNIELQSPLADEQRLKLHAALGWIVEAADRYRLTPKSDPANLRPT